jgi:hypothetical protein
MRHDPGLAASPGVSYRLIVEGSARFPAPSITPKATGRNCANEPSSRRERVVTQSDTARGYPSFHGHGGQPGSPGARYQRPYAVPERLDLLRGPSSGTVRLPSYLDWSGNAIYDLDAPGRVIDLYRAVLNEAASPQDLYTYLDETVLLRLWAMLWLPAQLRRAWEQRFPVLAEIRRITAAA